MIFGQIQLLEVFKRRKYSFGKSGEIVLTETQISQFGHFTKKYWR